MNVSSVKNLNGEVFSAVQDASLTNVVQTNSGNWQDITAYQSNSASYLTAHQDLSDYYTTADASTLSSMLSGAIDYVSANAGDEFPVSADEAIQYVQTNSGTIDDTVTSYQTNSGTYLTAHQAISADEWNSNYETVNTNSGAWGGSALPISAGPGIKFDVVNGTLVASNDETVLFSGERYISATGAFTLSENPYNFEKIQLWGRAHETHKTTLGTTIMPNADDKTYTDVSFIGVQDNLDFVRFNVARFDINSTGFNIANQKQFSFNQSGPSTANAATVIVKVIGINRVAGGN